ncbi:MlaD family protein [Aurantiacibacter gangjinensis]|uniref:Mammalian cell entry protein n=1 Tax=Aurantiacibacter gangjinensis TaxID=502682 RepID=A0A0G9MS29_9SPHN|nr:MlaD family protein [Aurantiacibacter gangjinensis]APE27102.1 ABC-type transport system periplasmic component [Aurantiacibacter gangjinensis]KLE33520.1 mammalian cell entry protein [Aurantiacibacter gangjinensis]
METRANHIWVGAVTLLLLAGAAIFFIWLARLSDRDNKEYDIFFEQSVGGVANGSVVTYSGVPVGQVSDISIWERDPEFVKVRITIDGDTPILVGTEASVSASFTGVSNISLSGGQSDQPPISCDTTTCVEGVPVIPPAPGAIGEILASAPLLLERLATLTDRLTRVLDDENQDSISGILRNTDAISQELAATSPEIQRTLQELQGTLAQSTETLAAFEGTLETTDTLLESEGRQISAELRATLASASSAAEALEASLANVEPLTQQLNQDTLPAATATLRDLRETSANLRAMTERLETEGAGSLLGGPELPDYEP